MNAADNIRFLEKLGYQSSRSAIYRYMKKVKGEDNVQSDHTE